VTPESPLDVSLTSKDPQSEDNVIYKSSADDPCRVLSANSKFGVAFTVVARLREEYSRGGISSFLGSLLVDWRPSTLDLPKECIPLSSFAGFHAHGPLALVVPCTTRFRGPPCYVERAPFEVKAVNFPSSLSAATPFDVKYVITNTTNMHQELKIRMGGSSDQFEGSVAKVGGLLVAGFTQGQLALGPSEQQTFSFTIIASRPGEVALPALQISSSRYQRWIINDGDGVSRKRVFVLP